MRPLPDTVDLDFDAAHVYLDAARNALADARRHEQVLASGSGDLAYFSLAELEDIGDDIDLQEEDYEGIESAHEQAREAFGRLMQSLAVCHVLCTMSLEAHVNIVARRRLGGGKMFDAFDKLSLEGKWLFLLPVLGAKAFDPGTEPFQGLTALVGMRNALVHTKGAYMHLQLSKEKTAEAVLSAGLSRAEASLATTEASIRELALRLGEAAPGWLAVKVVPMYTVSPPEDHG